MAKKLTENQKKFVDYYLEIGKGGPAYKKAYKSCKKDATADANAWRLLRNAKVKEYMEERVDQLDSERIADLSEIFSFWTDFIRTDKRKVVDENGEVRTIINDPKDRLRASENLARAKGAFMDRVHNTGEMTVNHRHRFDNLTKEEIKELLRGE